MAVRYKLYQNAIKTSKNYKKWYARATVNDVITTEQIAYKIQQNCSVKKSDVKAVLDEMVEVMTEALQDGKRVKIGGIGSFKIALSSKPSDNREDFNARQCIYGLRVAFNPEVKVNGSGRRVKAFLDGVQLAEQSPYDNGKTPAEAPTVEP